MGGIYWLASYPKSGNTWLRIFLANLQSDSEAPVSINALREEFCGDGRAQGSIASDRRWLDDLLGCDTADLYGDEVHRLRPAVYRWATRADAVEICKIHDAYTLTPDGEPLVSREATLGAVYLVRNPLDVAPSFAHHLGRDIDHAIARMGDPDDTLAPSGNKLLSQVAQRLLGWSGHVRSWVEAPDLRLIVLRYEDMLGQPTETFTAAARFLGLPADPSRITRAIHFSRFDEVVRQETEYGFDERTRHDARFFRQGRSGAWRDQLTSAQVERIIADHAPMMRRFGYLDVDGEPL